MGKDVILNKIETIERCINRINEVYANNPENLNDYIKQDSIIKILKMEGETYV